jgi:hypothetical protein
MAHSSLVPKISLSGVQQVDKGERDTVTGPAGPRLGSTSPRPERAARRQPGAISGAKPAVPSAFDIAENAAQLQIMRASMRRSSVSQAPWDENEEYDCCHRPPPPITLSHKVRLYYQPLEQQNQITATACSLKGDMLMWGDRSGRIMLLDREDGIVGRGGAFAPMCRRIAYVQFVDPLHSVDVSPAVTAAAFVPPVGPSNMLLTCNERIPKLWKIVQAPTSLPPQFRAVDLLGSRTVGPLTVQEPSVGCVEVAKYNMDHEYSILSVLPSPDGQHFITVDGLTVRLWAAEMPHMSMDICSIRPPEGSEVKESFTCAASSVRDPSLIMCCTTAGFIRVLDTRCGLKLSADNELLGAAMVLRNPPRAVDGDFSQVSVNVLGCCATPCGNYIVSRDFMTVQLFDIRMASGASPNDGLAPGIAGGQLVPSTIQPLVKRWAIHPEQHRYLDDVYQAGVLFDLSPIGLINDGRRWVTGTFGGRVVSASLGDDAASVDVESLMKDATDTSATRATAYEQGAAECTARRVKVLVNPNGGPATSAAQRTFDASGKPVEDGDSANRSQVTVCGETGDCFAAMNGVLHHFWLE